MSDAGGDGGGAEAEVKGELRAAHRVRALGVVLAFTLGFTAISLRLVHLQMVEYERYWEEAAQMHYDVVPVPARRGAILDARGAILAETLTVTDLRIDGKLALEDAAGLERVAEALGRDAAELRAGLSAEKRYQLVLKDLDPVLEERLRALQVRALIFQGRLQRVYPKGREGSHVIGFTNRQDQSLDGDRYEVERGMAGAEKLMDGMLTGMAGERRVVRDRDQQEIPAYRMLDRQPRDGMDVVLTLDAGVQHIVELEADRLVAEYQPESMSIVVVRPGTGEILALVNRPTFDPNDRGSMKPGALRNGAIMDLFEPGSVFKMVTLAAALNEGLVDLETPVFCENGQFFHAGVWLKDTHAYGSLPVREAMAVSSNIGMAKLGLTLQGERLYRYIRQFGFGEKVQAQGQALEGEQAGILRPPQYWSRVSETRVPIGYEVAVTNLQMAMAYGAAANEGKLMEPRLVRAVVDGNGKMVKQYLPRVVRQVVTRETAAAVVEALQGVVDGGTGKAAAVAGLAVAGKTGTARKVIEGSYLPGAYYASFIGFAPAERPEFLVSVVVNHPRGDEYYAGKVAAPVFQRVATRVAQMMDVAPGAAQQLAAVRRVEAP